MNYISPMKKIAVYLILIAGASLLAGFKNINLIKTTLHITIRDEVGNIVEGATVRIFEKEEDYKNETNPAAEGTTDEKGIVKFKELKPMGYFVLAEKGDLNNFGGGEQTGKLDPNRINKVTIIIQ